MASRLSQLRALFKDEALIGGSAIQAYLLPSTDAHQSEYLAPSDFRVRFLSNFSGSNAYVIVTEDKALLWTDGRYFTQADKQLSKEWTLMKQGLPETVTPEDWITENFNAGTRIGFDPSLHRFEQAQSMLEKFQQNKIIAVELQENLVDCFWTERPPASVKKVIALSQEQHGRSTSDKVREIREVLSKKKAKAVLFSELDDIMWLMNIRGFDIPFNPLAFSIVFVTETDLHLFIDLSKIDDTVAAHLNQENVQCHPYPTANHFLQNWHNENRAKPGYKIFIPQSTNYSLGSIFEKQNIIVSISPIQLMKAVKNPIEMQGMRDSHVRDSAALVEFLCWLEKEVEAGNVVDEIIAAEKINHLRSEQSGFVDLSFDTISASGEHAALPHYKHDDETGKATISKNSVYLLDSGGQYRDGTTDVTRTVVIGEGDKDFIEHNTLVLIGHIENAIVRFPKGILGIRLDTLTRKALWERGLDFGHGTGHGVGHFLNVHEGPCGISYRTSNPDGGLKAGMVLTIEPGYYLPGKYGTRIENCYELVDDSEHPGFLLFKELTLAPIQKSIIKKDLLEKKHIDWLNGYHERVLKIVGEYLLKNGKKFEYEWLKKQCSPL
ncbi:unnamed protein product, partial [Mesorhabditis belari]|uniref:Xaa-Pro aminopeptidase n=1 Tax=Mesorhabditis belari TaxID=2138241 RepID=A0AAF3EZL7_9BILA